MTDSIYNILTPTEINALEGLLILKNGAVSKRYYPALRELLSSLPYPGRRSPGGIYEYKNVSRRYEPDSQFTRALEIAKILKIGMKRVNTAPRGGMLGWRCEPQHRGYLYQYRQIILDYFKNLPEMKTNFFNNLQKPLAN